MATEKTVKITKVQKLNTLEALVNYCENDGVALDGEVTYDDLHEFVAHEIELLGKKAESVAKRAAAKKAEGDELRETVFNCLSTDEGMTNAEIVAAIGDPEVTPAKVTARLTQLIKLERVEKVTVEGKKGQAYRAIG